MDARHDEPRARTSDLVLEAALETIGRADPDVLFGFLRAQQLADKVGRARNSVTKAFPGEYGGFSTRRLAIALARRTIHEMEEVGRANIKSYLQALDSVRRGASLVAVVSAVASDIGQYSPSDDPRQTARERLYYLLTALADSNAEISGLLRELEETLNAEYIPVYEGFREVLGRQWSVDRATTQKAIACYLEGVALRRRAGLTVTDEEAADAVMRLFLAYTTPSGVDLPESPLDALDH